jgi:DNA-binding FadR family transcriptional regulator
MLSTQEQVEARVTFPRERPLCPPPAVRRPSVIRDWLTRIAVNEAIGRARRRGPYASFDDQDSVEGVLPMPAANNPARQAFTREMKVILESACCRCAAPRSGTLTTEVQCQICIRRPAPVITVPVG